MVDLSCKLRTKPMVCRLRVLSKPSAQKLNLQIVQMPICGDARNQAQQTSAGTFTLMTAATLAVAATASATYVAVAPADATTTVFRLGSALVSTASVIDRLPASSWRLCGRLRGDARRRCGPRK